MMTDCILCEFPFILSLSPTSVSATIKRVVYCDVVIDWSLIGTDRYGEDSDDDENNANLNKESETDIKLDDDPTLVLRALILIATIVCYPLYIL
jgi:hypothetical protein